jgi:hypothetical protein
MHLSLFGKTVVMVCLNLIVVILQVVDVLANAIPAGLMKITWGLLLLFFVWFVAAIYKDYKEFKARVYPYITDFHTRISVIEKELELKR